MPFDIPIPPNMPTNINCVCFLSPNKCTHQAAPRAWFGPATCVKTIKSYDPRIKGYECALQVPHIRPEAPPKAL